MTPSEFSKAIKEPDIFLLDVRPLADYEKAHIEGAHHLDVASPDFKEEAIRTLPKNETIAVYCNTGKRSALAQQQLEELGYKVINLDQGITSWIAAGLPTVAS
ncbi:MAG: rhodanese-like domain-containing protein [Muribaculaceae bacterium]|nr:rhodanese-like domain-containing protein [Muribaculaceae bacterium]